MFKTVLKLIKCEMLNYIIDSKNKQSHFLDSRLLPLTKPDHKKEKISTL